MFVESRMVASSASGGAGLNRAATSYKADVLSEGLLPRGRGSVELVGVRYPTSIGSTMQTIRHYIASIWIVAEYSRNSGL